MYSPNKCSYDFWKWNDENNLASVACAQVLTPTVSEGY